MNNFFGWIQALCVMTVRRVVLITLLGIVMASQAAAQSYTFNNVQVEGNQRIAEGTILTYAGIARGERVSTADLNDAAQRIRASGLFESVAVIPQGSTLIIRVVEYPTINRISIEGNRSLDDAELIVLVRSQPRRVFSPAQAERDAAAIADAYAQRGRINATVTPRIIRLSDNRVNLVFEVVEAGVTEIERISFIGNRTYSETRLRRVLDTKQAGVLRVLIARDTYIADRIAYDQQLLTDFYHSRGYADFTVQNVDVVLTRERDAFLITFNIQEGQKFTFGDVTVSSEIEGVNADDFADVIRVRRGVTYSPVPIDTDVTRLERLALQQGLNFVQVEPRITRNDRALELNVEYVLVDAPRIFVERIDIEGNTTTLDRVIRGQFEVVEGDPFNPREIAESARRIRALGFFADVQVQTREGSTSEEVIIDVDVVEGPTGSLSFGANYNSDSGVGLIASYKQSNFRGRGQKLAFDLSTAESNRLVKFDFTEPQFLGRDLRFGVSLSYRTTDNENALYDTDAFRFSPSLSFRSSENGRLQLYYAYDYTDLTDVSSAASVIIQNESSFGAVSTHSLGYSYSFDTRRTGLNPNAGVILRFGQEFGFGDAQFIQTTALAGVEANVLNEEVTLRATLEGGLLSYSQGDSRVTDRFFLGSRIMRGFEAGGIGPRDDLTDDALGGNAYSVARLEAEFPLGLPSEFGLSGGVFLDYGSVWDVGNTYGQSVIYNDFTPRAVAGVAIFWTTPIGPLRFNFTEALDAQDRDSTKSFDVTISTSF